MTCGQCTKAACRSQEIRATPVLRPPLDGARRRGAAPARARGEAEQARAEEVGSSTGAALGGTAAWRGACVADVAMEGAGEHKRRGRRIGGNPASRASSSRIAAAGVRTPAWLCVGSAPTPVARVGARAHE